MVSNISPELDAAITEFINDKPKDIMVMAKAKAKDEAQDKKKGIKEGSKKDKKIDKKKGFK